MMILSIVTFLSFLLLIISLFINSFGGIYTHSYTINDDLYRISELQGSGNSDHILIILGSFILFIFMLITLIIRSIKYEIKSYLFLIYFALSTYIYNLIETSSFIEVTYSTIFLGRNYIYTFWFSIYTLIFIIITYKFIFFLKQHSA